MLSYFKALRCIGFVPCCEVCMYHQPDDIDFSWQASQSQHCQMNVLGPASPFADPRCRVVGGRANLVTTNEIEREKLRRLLHGVMLVGSLVTDAHSSESFHVLRGPCCSCYCCPPDFFGLDTACGLVSLPCYRLVPAWLYRPYRQLTQPKAGGFVGFLH